MSTTTTRKMPKSATINHGSLTLVLLGCFFLSCSRVICDDNMGKWPSPFLSLDISHHKYSAINRKSCSSSIARNRWGRREIFRSIEALSVRSVCVRVLLTDDILIFDRDSRRSSHTRARDKQSFPLEQRQQRWRHGKTQNASLSNKHGKFIVNDIQVCAHKWNYYSHTFSMWIQAAASGDMWAGRPREEVVCELCGCIENRRWPPHSSSITIRNVFSSNRNLLAHFLTYNRVSL